MRVLSVCECFENTHITQNTLKAHPNHSGYLNRIDRMMWKEEMMEYSAATTPCRLMWLSVDTTG